MKDWGGLKQALKTDPAGVAAVLSITLPVSAAREQMQPDPQTELAWIVEKESSWDPAAENPKADKQGKHATGLIQFLPSTARFLGTTVEQLKVMTRAQQAPFVQKYFDQVSGGAGSKSGHPGRVAKRVGDLYLLTFAPIALDFTDDQVIFEVGTKAWQDNPAFRDPGDGPIRAGTVRRAGTPSTLKIPGPGGGGGLPIPSGGGRGGLGLVVLLGLYLASRRKKRRR